MRLQLQVWGLMAVAAVSQPLFAEDANKKLGPHANYMLECQGCHSPDGLALFDQVPAFKGQLATFLSIEGGREYLVKVPGAAKSRLADDDLAELLNWMLVRFDKEHVPTSFSPYTADEVAYLRVNAFTNATSVRAALLENANRKK